MNNSIFEKYGDYYELLYKDKDYFQEAQYVNNLISYYGKSFKDILEFGSGTGQHGRILAKMGYTVHGIELSSNMVSKAKIIPGFTCQQGDIGMIKLDKCFDVIISLFHVMNYLTTNEKLKGVFENARDHLNNNGLFIFDFWYTPAINFEKPSIKIKRVANKDIEITRISEPVNIPNRNIVNINYSIYVKDLFSKKIDFFKETHSVRHFSLLDIDDMCKEFGFERLTIEEFKTGNKISEATWGPCVVLKKI